jgi:hypothetical protein
VDAQETNELHLAPNRSMKCKYKDNNKYKILTKNQAEALGFKVALEL